MLPPGKLGHACTDPLAGSLGHRAGQAYYTTIEAKRQKSIETLPLEQPIEQFLDIEDRLIDGEWAGKAAGALTGAQQKGSRTACSR
jgi:hypothetical protein